MTDSSKAGREERSASPASTSPMEWMVTAAPSLPATSGEVSFSRESICSNAVSIGLGLVHLTFTRLSDLDLGLLVRLSQDSSGNTL